MESGVAMAPPSRQTVETSTSSLPAVARAIAPSVVAGAAVAHVRADALLAVVRAVACRRVGAARTTAPPR
jgi:hypothetical protein